MPSFDTPQPISVTIEVQLGDVQVSAGDRVDTVVVANPSDRSRAQDVEAAEKTRVEYSDGRLLIKAPKPRGLGNYIGLSRTGSVDVTIELPTDSNVHGEAGWADFRGNGRLGDIRIKTGAGDIRLDSTRQLHLASGAGSVTVNAAAGHTELTTAGEMRIGEIDGDAEIKNLNGKTWLGEVTGALRVKSANGDISVDRALAEVVAKTANGNIQIGEVVSGSVELATASGELEIGIRDGTAAWVDAKTQFGRVHNDLGSTDAPEASQETVQIQARTSFGNIVIHRS
ncbi:MAG: DUF4097 domain-containing protein [Actinomycetota bacterium]|nr:DUF4097 domain-containing protein [Actinomycetota bacterium]